MWVGPRGRGYRYTCSWFTLFYSRNRVKHIVVKQLHPNKKIVLVLKKLTVGLSCLSAGEPLFCDGVSQRRRLNVPHPELPQVRPLQSHVRALCRVGGPLCLLGDWGPLCPHLAFSHMLYSVDLNSRARWPQKHIQWSTCFPSSQSFHSVLFHFSDSRSSMFKEPPQFISLLSLLNLETRFAPWMEVKWKRGHGADVHRGLSREAQSKPSSIQLWGQENWRTGRDICLLSRINLHLLWRQATLDAGFPGGSGSEESTCRCRRCKRLRFDP